MAPLILLFAYAFASNVAISVIPHEPVVIAAGLELGLWPTALVATAGTVLAGIADVLLFGKFLANRGRRASGLAARLLSSFDRAPFAILVAASLTPLPFWPFKALALSSGYGKVRYLVALGVGRLPRYLLLAWLGQTIALPPAIIVAISLALTAVALLWRPKSPRNHGPRTEEPVMTEEKAQRTTRSLTHAWEKRNLPRMARALPQWVTPDHLTGLGVVAAAVIGAGYLLAHLHPAWMALSIVGLAVHWFGDSLDGTLARVRKQERERYGYYVDRTADAISTVIIGLCFGLSPYVQLPVAMMMTIGYLLLQLYAEICAYTSRTFPLSFGRMGPTEARIVLGGFTLGLIFWQPVSFALGPFTMTFIDLGVLAVSVGLFATFVLASLAQAKQLDLEDRAAWRDPVTTSGFTISVSEDD